MACCLILLTVYIGVTCVLSAPLQVKEIQLSTTVADGFEHLNVENLQYTPEGTVIIGDIEYFPHRNAIANLNNRWPQGRVPYIISSAYSTTMYNTIIEAMRELEHNVNGPQECIKFIPRTTQPSYIAINNGTGCHSQVGYFNSGRQNVSLGIGCTHKGTIMHELIHTLGFHHEHSRSDRDNYVNINLTNVKTEELYDFSLMANTNNLHTTYDYSSIMHYGSYAFAKDPSHPVITPKPGHTVVGMLGQRESLSVTDVLKIQRLYGCHEDTTHITTLAPRTLMECHFVNTVCNITIENTPVRWGFNSLPSPAGPIAGNSYGADPYILVKESPSNPGVARFHTPYFTSGSFCMKFFVYQKGPSSYLEVLASGPTIQSLMLKTLQYQSNIFWEEYFMHVDTPPGTEFRLTFQAHVNHGDVAIDDLHIYSSSSCI